MAEAQARGPGAAIPGATAAAVALGGLAAASIAVIWIVFERPPGITCEMRYGRPLAWIVLAVLVPGSLAATLATGTDAAQSCLDLYD